MVQHPDQLEETQIESGIPRELLDELKKFLYYFSMRDNDSALQTLAALSTSEKQQLFEALRLINIKLETQKK